MEITRLTTIMTDRGKEYHREETLDGNFYWKVVKQHSITGELVKVPLPQIAVEQMEERHKLLYTIFPLEGAPSLDEMLTEVAVEDRSFLRREILLGGVIWYRRNDEAKSEKHRWSEVPQAEQEAMEERFQQSYPQETEEEK